MAPRKSLTAAVAVILLMLAAPAFGAEHGEEPSIFAGSIGNFIFTLIIFSAVIVILTKLAWNPVLTVLNERERNIRGSLEAAKKERGEARQLLADYQAKLDQARGEATAIVEEGRRDAEVVGRNMQQQSRAQAEALVERARREIKLATETAVKELYDQTAELSVRIATGVIRKELSPEDHARLVNESLEQMKSVDRSKLN